MSPSALRMADEDLKRIPSKGWAEMIRKVYEVDTMVCPKGGGRMKVVTFITEYAVADWIIDHLKLRFVADKPPPSHVLEQVEPRRPKRARTIFDHLIFTGKESLLSFSRFGRVFCPNMLFRRRLLRRLTLPRGGGIFSAWSDEEIHRLARPFNTPRKKRIPMSMKKGKNL